MNTDFDHVLTEVEEDELIKKHPHKYFRDDNHGADAIVGMSTGLIGGSKTCHHLATPSSGGGIHCVKCGAWFCF